MAPNTLGRFEVFRELACWEFGCVLRAIDPVTRKPVIIRQFDPSVPAQKVRQALDAAAKAICLDSPTIARVYEVGNSENSSFLVWEYVEGETLRSLLEQQHKFSSLELADITRQVCSALDHAHARGMVHPNLHPGNVVQEWDGNVKLLDYGVNACALNRVQDGKLPPALSYVSPEQASGSTPDLRSNLFSWGAILYELLFGARVFPGESPAEVLDRIAHTDPATPEASSTTQAALLNVVLKALAKSPDARYQSGNELARAVEDCNKPAPKVLSRKPAVTAPAPVGCEPALNPPVQPAKAVVSPPREIVKPAAKPLSTNSPSTPAVAPASSAHQAVTTDVPSSAGAAEFIVVPSRLPRTAAPLPRQAASTPKTSARLPRRLKVPPIKRVALFYGLGILFLVLVGSSLGAILRYRNRQPVIQSSAQTIAKIEVLEQPAAQESPDELADSSDTAGAVVDRTVHPVQIRKKKTAITSAPVAPLMSEVLIDSTPQGAHIEVNGTNLGMLTPYRLSQLSAGDYTVRVSKPGYSTESRALHVNPGETLNLAIPLTELLATINITTDPSGASILLDGKSTGKLTPASIETHKGSHSISVTRAGFFESAANLEVEAGRSYQFAPRLAPMGHDADVQSVSKLKSIFGGKTSEAMARVEIKTNPKGARITVNQRTMDKATPAEFMFPSGIYEVTLTAPGYNTIRKTINVVQGSRLVIEEPMQKAGL